MHFSFIVSDSVSPENITLHITGRQNEQLSLATPLRIAPKDWDSERERPLNIYLKAYKKLNTKLDRLRIAIAGYLKEVQANTAVLSVRAIQRRMIKTLNDDPTAYPAGSLLHAMDRYIHSRLHLISDATRKRYQVFLRLLERFEGYMGMRYAIKHVNGAFVRDFMTFGQTEQYSPSTIIRSLHFVRTILNHLEKRGVRTFIYELEIPKVAPKTQDFVTLTEGELADIQKTEVPKNLQSAKDWLLISSYAGQRISDFMQFSTTELLTVGQAMCIGFVQQKTQKYILLPLHPVILAILKQRDGEFPQRLSTTTYNRQIKAVVRLAGIHQKVKTRKRRGFRAKEEITPKWEAVTSHIGRRSFASNFFGRIPTALLMEATGHSTEVMFRRYIGDGDTTRATALAAYFERIYNSNIARKNSPETPTITSDISSWTNSEFVNPKINCLNLAPQ